MGYKLEAFILNQQAAEMLPDDFRHLHRFRLSDRLTLVPATRYLYKEVVETFGVAADEPDDDSWFIGLHPALSQMAAQVSHVSPVLYLEVDVASGIGDKSAVVWHQGQAVYGPTWGSSQVTDAFSLFAQLEGLSSDWVVELRIFRYRFTEDWLQLLENDGD